MGAIVARHMAEHREAFTCDPALCPHDNSGILWIIIGAVVIAGVIAYLFHRYG